jgi:hypothetical protein
MAYLYQLIAAVSVQLQSLKALDKFHNGHFRNVACHSETASVNATVQKERQTMFSESQGLYCSNSNHKHLPLDQKSWLDICRAVNLFDEHRREIHMVVSAANHLDTNCCLEAF